MISNNNTVVGFFETELDDSNCPITPPLIPEEGTNNAVLNYQVLLILFFVANIVTNAVLLLRYKKHPMFKNRSIKLILLSSLGGIFCACTILIPLIDGIWIGHGYDCDTWLWMRALTFPFYVTPSIVRLVTYVNKERWADRVTDVVKRHRHSSFAVENRCLSFFLLLLRCCSIRKRSDSSDSSSENSDSLIQLRFVSSRDFGYILASFLFLPYVILTWIKYLTTDYYGIGCKTCFQNNVEDVTGLAQIFLIYGYSYWLLYKTKPTSDPFHLLLELKATVIVNSVLWSLRYILSIVDPGSIQEEGYFSFNMLSVFAAALCQHIQVTIPLVRSFCDKTKYSEGSFDSELDSDDSTMAEGLSFTELLEIPEWRARFRDHLKEEFSVENLVFWEQTNEFEKYFSERLPEESDEFAIGIYNLYIRDRAMLQVNIPHKMKRNLDNVFRKFKRMDGSSQFIHIPKEMFQDANESVFKLMRSDSYLRFLHKHFGEKSQSWHDVVLPHISEEP